MRPAAIAIAIVVCTVSGAPAAGTDMSPDDIRFATAREFADLSERDRLRHFTPMIEAAQAARSRDAGAVRAPRQPCREDTDVRAAARATAAYIEEHPDLNELPVPHVMSLALSLACERG